MKMILKQKFQRLLVGLVQKRSVQTQPPALDNKSIAKE